jgi:hypothetical protein
MAAKGQIPFFTDEDVPDSVGNVIAAAGHGLTRLRDAILTGSPDPVVAATCQEGGLVLVTCNYRDFRKMTQQMGVTRRRANGLCRIELGCKQHSAANRMQVAMSIIEHEWARYQVDPNNPLVIYVGDGAIQVRR